ncbi:MAG: hypothetical protein LBG80_17130 [Bacteroidales bacterium]|jgi:hypothetical protein|nr:hypothetical protein [Bacteroidales bacterium]
MFTINGIGTKLYGRADEDSKGAYTATKWVVFLFFPIIPICSYRVLSEEDGIFSSKYQLIPVPLNKRQVLRTYLAAFSILILLFAFIRIIIYFDI